MKLGKVIHKYRINNELTLRELAQEIGIGAATLMRLEQGRDPDGATLAKVLNWLLSSESKGKK
jgi:transcriptional regulator with XRE-family HTH domain